MPVYGTITDSRGKPIAGATISANADGDRTTSDTAGRFVLSGFGSNPRFQLQVKTGGYAFINWGVRGSDDGLRWREVGGDPQEHGPMKELAVVMQQEAWIEGEAVDEATGLPVRLDRVVLCFFERKPDGEVVLNGCRTAGFEQPRDGRFRVPYSTADELHLTLSAKGYHDAEAFTPKVETLTLIENLHVKMRKKDENSEPTIHRQTISGTVTDHGVPVETGWIGLWDLRQNPDVVNAYVMRGRTVAGDPAVYASAPIRGGKYSLTVPFQGDALYLVAESPARVLTQVGPIAVALGEQKPLDIESVDGGQISGRVDGCPAGWEDDLWVVAFTDTAIRAETRVNRDGTFSLKNLPPGRYGLKVGHDAYRDSEVPHRPNISPDHWRTNADPWKRAKTVEVTAGEHSRDIVLELPAD
ncbi:MAG TPA: carboxypeptidase-like regulatory domain-containing protein [Pirellulales bacterium]|nr:carboxypeptidase-like regulatory domain-containing protein [Pirellulales bacterium]